MGNARTALFNALFAIKASGTFLLRIEDTDRERSKSEYTDALMRDLLWLGLPWQEGPEHDGGAGPYYQSERQAIYDDYYERLETAGMAYPCFCTEAELALSRKIQRASGKPPRYAGTCRGLSATEIEAKRAAGLSPTLRFKVLEDEVVAFDDVVRGPLKFNSDDIGDFIIRRANGTSPFMFCNAIDDALMGVTHVFRGEDHLTNTPRQLMILDALGLQRPTYGHIALILALDGSPLSKRNGSRSIEELRLDGYLPEAIVNYMARLGHYYGHDELLTVHELAAQITEVGLSKSPAKYNPQQLDYWQKLAVSQVEAMVLWDWLSEETQALIPEAHREAFLALIKPNIHKPDALNQWAKLIFDQLPPFDDGQKAVLQQAGVAFFTAAQSAIAEQGQDFKQLTQHLQKTLGVKGKALYQPLRIALTGESHGPELAKVLLLLDVEEIQRRFENAKLGQ